MRRLEDLDFVSNHYYSYMKRFGYLPNIFCPYNDAEVIDGIANTITTNCGSIGSSATHLMLVDEEGQLLSDKLDLPCIVASRGRNSDNPSSRKTGIDTEQRLEVNTEGTSNCLTTIQKDNWVIEPCVLTKERTEFGKQVRKDYEAGKVNLKRAEMTEYTPRKDGCSGTITTVQKDNYVVECDNMTDLQYIASIKNKDIVGDGKTDLSRNASMGNRVYDSDGIATTILAEGGGIGGHSGLYKVDEKDDTRIKVVGNYKPSGHNCGRIIQSEGVAPTVMENHGAVTAILEESNPKITKAKIKEAVAKSAKHQQDLVNDSDGVSATLVAGSHLNSDTYTKTVVDVDNHKYPFRIRKLTPKECWRLQGFDDEDIDRCIAGGVSSSQLYKQAGNSIAVNCLCAIFQNLLGIPCDSMPTVDVESRLF